MVHLQRLAGNRAVTGLLARDGVAVQRLDDGSPKPVALSDTDRAALDQRRQELGAALQSPDPAENKLFVVWRDNAKKAWAKAAPEAEAPSDQELFETWSKIATAFSRPGGLIDKAMAAERGAGHKQGGGLSAGSFSSWDDTRIIMGRPEFQTVLKDAEVVAESFAGHFVKDLQKLRTKSGATAAFWSGDGASEAAAENCDVALEKSSLARSFDWNPISSWSGGTEAILWASLSNRYAEEIARMWDDFHIHGFIGPGVRDLTVFDNIESKALIKVLGNKHGPDALQRITWHGVKLKAKQRRPDFDTTDGQMKGSFIKGKKKFVELAVMGMREQ
jgi:hypothetical protein